jgi:hypothetical protein
LYEKWSCKEVARKGLRTGNVTDGRCVLFEMIGCLFTLKFQAGEKRRLKKNAG